MSFIILLINLRIFRSLFINMDIILWGILTGNIVTWLWCLHFPTKANTWKMLWLIPNLWVAHIIYDLLVTCFRKKKLSASKRTWYMYLWNLFRWNNVVPIEKELKVEWFWFNIQRFFDTIVFSDEDREGIFIRILGNYDDYDRVLYLPQV